ncbi:MAG: HAD family hydrolase [Oscillospiraceae bacterium]|nr:HAD family hydrolase [Oscillospiraceae bacterium]
MKIGILFDLDGTLLDTIGDLHTAVNYALSQFGYPPREKAEIRAFLGNGMRNLIKRSMPEGVTDEQVEETLAVYQPYYDSHNLILTKPYDGVLPAIDMLGEKYAIGVVSNKQDTAVKPMCARFFGEGLYALGEVPGCPRKPAPDMLYGAMDALGVEKAVYVGDSEVDLKVAENAGLPCLLVTWGFRDKAQLELAGGKNFCDDPQKLAEALEELIRKEFNEK